MASRSQQSLSVLVASAASFTICFAVWMMSAVIGIPLKSSLGLNETQFGLLVATPVLTGSLVRLPLGMLTDKVGGRIVFFVLMLSCVMPIWLIGEATLYWHFLVLGLFVGLARRDGCAPTVKEADQSLQRMIESIKSSSFGSFIAFDRQGQPMLFS